MDTLNNDPVRACEKLSPEASDAIFFPGVGNKSKRARLFCAPCPSRARCLLDAIEQNLEGFWAGTTKDERREMKKLREGLLQDLNIESKTKKVGSVRTEEYLPKWVKRADEGGRKPKLRDVAPVEDSYDYLDELDPSEDEFLTA